MIFGTNFTGLNRKDKWLSLIKWGRQDTFYWFSYLLIYPFDSVKCEKNLLHIYKATPLKNSLSGSGTNLANSKIWENLYNYYVSFIMYLTYYLLTSCFRNASITTQVTARKAKKKIRFMYNYGKCTIRKLPQLFAINKSLKSYHLLFLFFFDLFCRYYCLFVKLLCTFTKHFSNTLFYCTLIKITCSFTFTYIAWILNERPMYIDCDIIVFHWVRFTIDVLSFFFTDTILVVSMRT